MVFILAAVNELVGIITEFTTPVSTFAIGRALGEDPDLVVELERIVPTDESMIPFFWVWGDDLTGFESRLAAEPGVETDGPLAETERGRLYRIEWGNEMSELIRGLFDQEFTLLSGDATAERWRFEIRFDDGASASAFKRYLTENGVPHELTRVQGLADLDPPTGSGLTEKQRDALIEAYDAGYFQEPRAVTTGELADRLDIAPSSASGLLKRATGRLVESTLVADRAVRVADGT